MVSEKRVNEKEFTFTFRGIESKMEGIYDRKPRKLKG
ncbi:uncharacterized protein G2W53_019652 [Senna tora]|uniref:Uncharacterized protein n=1 Tax=Senna tora TaxID=362788 RepID=A0A834TUS6_9FABA|nr:uncharacterized protein G2W53_019652 [Senna tora]